MLLSFSKFLFNPYKKIADKPSYYTLFAKTGDWSLSMAAFSPAVFQFSFQIKWTCLYFLVFYLTSFLSPFLSGCLWTRHLIATFSLSESGFFIHCFFFYPKTVSSFLLDVHCCFSLSSWSPYDPTSLCCLLPQTGVLFLLTKIFKHRDTPAPAASPPTLAYVEAFFPLGWLSEKKVTWGEQIPVNWSMIVSCLADKVLRVLKQVLHVCFLKKIK